MGIVIAGILAAAAAIGLGAKEGVFEKGYDRTRQETIAFEKNALEMKLASLQSKHRQVVEIKGNAADAHILQAKLSAKEEKLAAKISALDKRLAESN